MGALFKVPRREEQKTRMAPTGVEELTTTGAHSEHDDEILRGKLSSSRRLAICRIVAEVLGLCREKTHA